MVSYSGHSCSTNFPWPKWKHCKDNVASLSKGGWASSQPSVQSTCTADPPSSVCQLHQWWRNSKPGESSYHTAFVKTRKSRNSSLTIKTGRKWRPQKAVKEAETYWKHRRLSVCAKGALASGIIKAKSGTRHNKSTTKVSFSQGKGKKQAGNVN